MMNDSVATIDRAERTEAPGDSRIEDVAAEARAHNERRFMAVQQGWYGMGVAADVYQELAKTKLYRFALFGTYLMFWGMAGLLLVLAFGSTTT